MSKTIRILAIISVGLVGFSLVLLVASVPLQRVLAQILDYPAMAIGELPIFPLKEFLFCLLRAGCVASLIICCGNEKGGIWLEILVLIVLVIVFPLINVVASTVYNQLQFGTERMAANSVVSTISAFCCYPANWGQALAYVTCGMSITFKAMSKKRLWEM